jgi:hypothetical protein
MHTSAHNQHHRNIHDVNFKQQVSVAACSESDALNALLPCNTNTQCDTVPTQRDVVLPTLYYCAVLLCSVSLQYMVYTYGVCMLMSSDSLRSERGKNQTFFPI